MWYNTINHSHYAVHYIPMTYSFYNWKFVPFDSFRLFWPPLIPHLWQPPIGIYEIVFWFFVFWLFKDSIYKWDDLYLPFYVLLHLA